MQMPIITSQYWNLVHSAAPEEVRQDLEGMQTLRTLGRNMAYFLKCRQLAREQGVELPRREVPIHPNFIR